MKKCKKNVFTVLLHLNKRLVVMQTTLLSTRLYKKSSSVPRCGGLSLILSRKCTYISIAPCRYEYLAAWLIFLGPKWLLISYWGSRETSYFGPSSHFVSCNALLIWEKANTDTTKGIQWSDKKISFKLVKYLVF